MISYKTNATTRTTQGPLDTNPADELCIKLLSSDGVVPNRATIGSAGLDLYSIDKYIIPSKQATVIGTGIAIAIPRGSYGRLATRSGMAVKNLIQILGGVIDNDYRGEIKVVLLNNSTETVQINRHDRIAQLIIERNVNPIVRVVSEFTEHTERNDRGFGSTGR